MALCRCTVSPPKPKNHDQQTSSPACSFADESRKLARAPACPNRSQASANGVPYRSTRLSMAALTARTYSGRLRWVVAKAVVGGRA